MYYEIKEKLKMKLLLLPDVCKESQLWRARNEAAKLFSSFEKKLSKTSRPVRETFTEEGISYALTHYYDHLNQCKTYPGSKRKFMSHRGLYKLLSNPNFLLVVYGKLRERGVKAPGVDDTLTQNVTLGGLRKLALELQGHNYVPSVSKRVYIPKQDGSNRPLGIASTRDKIVQLGIKMILDPLYEGTFKKSSFGFRTGLSCHSALKTIDLRWKRITWFVEADLVKAFDRIHHGVLRRELNRVVDDKAMINIIAKQVRVGYIDFSNLSNSKMESTIGTPQGSVLSPLLCNIYLHPLDEFMEEFILPKWNHPRVDKVSEAYKEAGRWTNNVWEPIADRIKELAPGVKSKEIRSSLHGIRKIDRVTRDIPYYAEDPNHCRTYYCRYADDFLVGHVGNKKNAWLILQQIAAFVEQHLNMKLHEKKSGVKHHENGVIFLGYHLHGRYEAKIQYNNATGQRTRSNWIKFGIPVERLFKRYAEKGFFQKAKKGNQDKYVARRLDKWIFLPSDLDVIRRYNAVASGIAQYYAGSRYPSALNEFWSVLKRSLALTLAHRHKDKTAKSAFIKWGADLCIPNSKGKPVCWQRPEIEGGKWKTGKATQGEIASILEWFPEGKYLPKTLSHVLAANDLSCSIPNCLNKAEAWHHVKHRKRYKVSGVAKLALDLSGKQIPVCKLHHVSIHSAKYDGPSLRKVPGFTIDSASDMFNKKDSI
jgi:RNA-directed DNA polymerase